MLLDEDPATLIHECTSNFHYASDRSSVNRISTSLSALQESRAFRLSQQTAVLKKLSRRHNTLAQQHEIEQSSADGAQHASEILRLDGAKFKMAKEASDAEIEGERLEGECRRAEAELLRRERAESGGEGAVDGERDVLKLKLYRSLGIDMEPDAEGQYTRAVVRSTRKGTAEVIEVDPQVSRSTYADRFWDAM